jgi:hypothetical protein
MHTDPIWIRSVEPDDVGQRAPGRFSVAWIISSRDVQSTKKTRE